MGSEHVKPARPLALLGALLAWLAFVSPATASVTVSASPDAPVTPPDGWSVAYADGFGAPLGTAPGEDNTLYPNSRNSCSDAPPFNAGSEMQTFNCSAATVTANGLALTCSYTPHAANFSGYVMNYTCGAAHSVMSNAGSSPSGYVSPPAWSFFNWRPGQGQEWAVEVKVEFPANTGEADPGWWSGDSPWTEEMDFFEGFGWAAGAGGTWCHATSGNGYIGTEMPAWIYNTATRAHLGAADFICRDLGFDPSAALHTYTTVIYPNNAVSEFVDGQPVAWSYVGGTGGADYTRGGTVIGPPPSLSNAWLGLILSYALKNSATGNPDPWFRSGTRTMLVRSVAVYENAGANLANTINPGVAPGTTLPSSTTSGGSTGTVTCGHPHKNCG
jgi:hypothetical protein